MVTVNNGEWPILHNGEGPFVHFSGFSYPGRRDSKCCWGGGGKVLCPAEEPGRGGAGVRGIGSGGRERFVRGREKVLGISCQGLF